LRQGLLVYQSSPDIEAFVANDIATAIATAVDNAAINGTGTAPQPLWILHYPVNASGSFCKERRIHPRLCKKFACKISTGATSRLFSPGFAECLATVAGRREPHFVGPRPPTGSNEIWRSQTR